MTNITTDDLLEMKLQGISDLFLEELNDSDMKCIKVDIPGCCKDERFILRVCLCKGDGLP